MKNEIYQECTQYVPTEDSLKVSIIKLKNNQNKEICLKIKYDLDLQMGENYDDKRFIVNVFKESLIPIDKAFIINKCPDLSETTIERNLGILLKEKKIIKLTGGRYTKYKWNS